MQLLTLLLLQTCRALPNYAQISFTYRPDLFRGVAHAVPLPSFRPLSFPGVLTSDGLCRRNYGPWLAFLRQQGILNAVQSTEVFDWGIDRKMMILNCNDVRDQIQWQIIHQLQRQWINYFYSPYRWMAEDVKQGPWVLICPEPLVVRITPRTNALHQLDTYGECVEEEQEKKEKDKEEVWWMTDQSVRLGNHPWTHESKAYRAQQSTCKDVEGTDVNQKQTTSALAFVMVSLLSICSQIHGLNPQQCSRPVKAF